MCVAAKYSRLRVVRRLLEIPAVMRLSVDRKTAALYDAVSMPDPSPKRANVVAALVEAKAEVDGIPSEKENSALWQAAESGHTDAMRVLLWCNLCT